MITTRNKFTRSQFITIKENTPNTLKTKHIRLPQPNNILSRIKAWLKPDKHYYLGFGGMGDACLLLASCWNDVKAQIIFFANSNSFYFINQLYQLFNKDLFLENNILGNPLANEVYDYLTQLPQFNISAHLADNCYYEDWKNQEKYYPRIVTYAPWIAQMGKKTAPVIIICPSGSEKNTSRQRFLAKNEYLQLMNHYLNKNIIVTGSMEDYYYYGLADNAYWMTSTQMINDQGVITNTSMKDLLQTIHAAEEVISVDTWLKTYSLLCDIPTTVIQTRFDGHYREFGGDLADWIFVNPKLWHKIIIKPIEQLLTVVN